MKISKKKLVVLIGSALSFSAWADTTSEPITIDDSYTATAFYPKTNNDNSIIVDTTKGGIAVNGSYYYERIDLGSDPKVPYVAKNNVIDVLAGNNLTVLGGYARMDSNRDANIEGTVNVKGGDVLIADGVQYRVDQTNLDKTKESSNTTLDGTINIDGGTISQSATGTFSEFYTTALTNGLGTGLTQNGTVNFNDGVANGKLTGSDIIIFAEDHNVNVTKPNTLTFIVDGKVNIAGGEVNNQAVGSTIKTNLQSNQAVELIMDGTVNVTGGSVKGTDAKLVGALVDIQTKDFHKTASYDLNITGNVVIDGGDVNADIYGVEVLNSDIFHPKANYKGFITIKDSSGLDIADRSLYGAYNPTGSAFYNVNYVNGSVLYMQSKPFSVGNLGNFGKYSFAVNSLNEHVIDNNAETMITVNNRLTNDDTINIDDGSYKTIKNKSYLAISGIDGTIGVKDNSRINLITLGDKAEAGETVSQPGGTSEFVSTDLGNLFNLAGNETEVRVGLVRKANVNYEVSEDGKTVYAVINKTDEDVKPVEPTDPGDDNNGSGGDDNGNTGGDDNTGGTTNPGEPGDNGTGNGGDDNGSGNTGGGNGSDNGSDNGGDQGNGGDNGNTGGGNDNGSGGNNGGTEPTEPTDPVNPGDGNDGGTTNPVEPGDGGNDNGGATDPSNPGTGGGDDGTVEPKPPVDPTDPVNPGDNGNDGDDNDDGIDKEEVARVTPALGVGYLNTLNTVNRGLDTVTTLLTGEHKPAGTVTPIAVLTGSKYRYKDAFSTTSNEYRLVVGSQYHITDTWFAGLVAERGQSNYHADANGIYGSGKSVNYGLTVYSKYSVLFGNNSAYLDGSLGFGKASTRYDSSNLVTGGGANAAYDVKGNYITGQIGAGIIHNFNNGVSFDTSVRYLHTHLNSNNFVIEGDKISFDGLNSNRVQIKEKVGYAINSDLTASVAAVYEYEFNGKLNGNIDGVNAKGGSLKGSTESLEVGFKALPFEDKNFSTDVLLTGSVGERKGVSGTLVVKYDF